ncbi:hypothetical protein [Alkalibacillus haloalkaliphilus]|uniref:hypothetical protein n=1 Tax=Alkalibacillus haloalkaliphilus TaxID=94136 RepID=UPI0002D6BEA2|nr:hypothetical protein [Alkalibacillus haloalkaliphilus]
MSDGRSRSAVCRLLRTLDPGTPVNEVFVNGESEPADYFASLDSDSNLAYFVQNDGDLLVADCNRIDMIEIDT